MSRIQVLNKETVSKIAAGEVVDRPSSALKELLENSIDAGSTSIKITLKEGGLSLLQITDNGHGIRAEDLPILCHRFTTSKIKAYADLSTLGTFGFRGEALSSISQVSRLTVCSRCQGEPVGFKAEYLKGELISKPNCYAINQGTSITAEDFFYDNPCRRRAFTNTNDLYNASWQIISSYALQFPNISFKLCKGETLDISSSGKGDVYEPLKILLKSERLSNEVIEIPKTHTDFCEISGMISNSQYSLKLKMFILFINDRLVESTDLKRLITEIYSKYMPKSGVFFVYLSIKVPTDQVDVNVHPSKQRVVFAKQSHVFAEVVSKIQGALDDSNISRKLTIKAFELPKDYVPKVSTQVRELPSVPLEWFLEKKPFQEMKEAEENLESIEQLKAEIFTGPEQDVLGNFSYVGCVNKDIVLIQHQTALYAVVVPTLIKCAVYQYVLNNFARFPCFEISNSDLSIAKLLELGLFTPSLQYNAEFDPPAEELLGQYTELLMSKRDLLSDYFSVEINEAGTLVSMPVLIDGLIQPDANYLPEFFIRLCTDVDWISEKRCLEKISELVAWLYSNLPDEWSIGENTYGYEYHFKNTLMPYLRGRVLADSRHLEKGKGLVHFVSTEDLYKIFERC